MVASTSSGVIQSGDPAGTMLVASSRGWQSDCRLRRAMTGIHHLKEKD
jgi:hypothetical protein